MRVVARRLRRRGLWGSGGAIAGVGRGVGCWGLCRVGGGLWLRRGMMGLVWSLTRLLCRRERCGVDEATDHNARYRPAIENEDVLRIAARKIRTIAAVGRWTATVVWIDNRATDTNTSHDMCISTSIRVSFCHKP